MANIATCPRCAKQLGLPDSISITDRAECPECQAVFLLGETVQIALPVARIVDRKKDQAATANSQKSDSLDEAEPTLVEHSSTAAAEHTPPRRNWEERLKKALARDVSGDEPTLSEFATSNARTAESRTPEISGIPTADSDSSSSAELELDPRTTATAGASRAPVDRAAPATLSAVATTKPAVRRPKIGSKTLADFGAAVDSVSLDPPPQRSESQNAADTVSVTSTPTVVGELPWQGAPGEEAEATKTEHAERVVEQIPGTTNVGPRFPKFAALVVGPVLGSLLGLYGLLWLQGAEADYIGLSRVVPDSLLPADWSSPSADSAFASAGRSAEVTNEAVHVSLLPDPPEMPPSQPSAASSTLSSTLPLPVTGPMKRDTSVFPASAVQQGAPAGSNASHAAGLGSLATASVGTVSKARITADQFSVLVDNAAAALPAFFVGNLSVPQSIHNKGQAYIALCRLAEHFDFSQQPGLTPAVQVKTSEARQLYQRASSQAIFREELSHIAARWWGYQQRPNLGIFLAGQVLDAQPEGTGALCWITLSEHSNVGGIPVLLNHQRYRTGDRIGVVGSVISSPSLSRGGAEQRVAAHYDYLLDTGQ